MYPTRIVVVPSGFLTQPSSAGVTEAPLTAAGASGIRGAGTAGTVAGGGVAGCGCVPRWASKITTHASARPTLNPADTNRYICMEAAPWTYNERAPLLTKPRPTTARSLHSLT